MSSWDEMVVVGHIARPHGRSGRVLVNPSTDFPAQRFAPGAALFVKRSGREERLTVADMQFHQGRPLLAFEGVSTMDAAEALAGAELRIPEADLAPLPEGSYYEHALVGCAVATTEGRSLGVVRTIEGSAGGTRLIVGSGRDEIQIPLAQEICVEIDVARRRIVVDPPEGLIELNAQPQAGARAGPAVRFDVVTIFPGMFGAPLAEGVVARAIERGIVTVAVHDLRDFTSDRHRTVDDVPFGGGPGMVLKPEPLFEAVEAIRRTAGEPDAVVLTSPQGTRFTQRDAVRLSRLRRVVILCGRYEGVDERVREHLATEELSIGDYVLSGGELAALVIIDATARLVPGVVGDSESIVRESFAEGLLDYPHYTRPAEYRGWSVPEVLVSGHHRRIEEWRRREALRRTAHRRPDLLREADLDESERAFVRELSQGAEHEGD
ncbi:MAG TPA: tRNA (guanosine(37)-N1)-methyltransferase TrmD [Vicinamibacterales bacterium]|nr:tRNA (guanosine(37)-N1)-methyltransferase TrmD [Vicinamibacterales bacterium]